MMGPSFFDGEYMNETIESIKPETIVEELLGHLKNGKKLYEQLATTLNTQYKIDGKSMAEWKLYFDIKIPQGVSLEQLGGLNAKLNDAINEAGFYLAKAELVSQSLKTGADAKFDIAFNALVDKYKTETGKLPANATLEKLSHTDANVKAALSNASAHCKFWKTITEFLYDQRKVIEQQRWILWTDMEVGKEGL